MKLKMCDEIAIYMFYVHIYMNKIFMDRYIKTILLNHTYSLKYLNK